MRTSCGWIRYGGGLRNRDDVRSTAVGGRSVAEEAADGFRGEAVDDVAGEAAEVLDGGAVRWRGNEADGGQDDLAGAGEEDGAIHGTKAGGDDGEIFGEGAVDAGAENAKGVLGDGCGLCVLARRERRAGGVGEGLCGSGVGLLEAFEKLLLLRGVLEAGIKGELGATGAGE